MKQLVLILMALSIAAFAPVSSNPCRQLSRQVMHPTRNIASFLGTHPTLETLSGPGCLYILGELKYLPSGANVMRDFGARGVDHVKSGCATAVSSIRYTCTEPSVGPARCVPEAYTYCGQWSYSVTAQPKYELAMELSAQIDTVYDKAQQLCASAMSWDEPATATALNDLLAYLDERIAPRTEALYGMSCGE